MAQTDDCVATQKLQDKAAKMEPNVEAFQMVSKLYACAVCGDAFRPSKV
jgi:hypothetical protein